MPGFKKKRLSIAKFGGSLIDTEGKQIPKILRHVNDLRIKDKCGPIVVFSAPIGFTDELIRLGEGAAQLSPISTDPLFHKYQRIAKRYVRDNLLKQCLAELNGYQRTVDETLESVNKRFGGSIKTKVLTLGGEISTSVLMDFVFRSNDLPSRTLNMEHWPIVTDDTFEDAVPLYEMSEKRLDSLTRPLEDGKIVSMAGFLGVTTDGLETVLGRGGSDLTAVFTSILLNSQYHTETLLFKDVPIQSADPKVVIGQKTDHIASLTYNEAHKASLMGMKIVQSPAISMARCFAQPLIIVPIDQPNECSVIKAQPSNGEIVKCLTGKVNCGILSIDDKKSRSLEDSLRIWERRNDFLDLGAETLETGESIRDFLFLDSDFLRKNEDRLRGFDESLKVEYGLGVVTLVGDRMRNSPGVASIAIGAITGINIKRALFAPHTSQIIIVVNEKNVKETVAAIHLKRAEMNKAS